MVPAAAAGGHGHDLAGLQRALDVGGVDGSLAAGGDVPLDEGQCGGVDVGAGDLLDHARAAGVLLVHGRHDAPVGQLGDQQPGEARQALLGVEHLGQLGRDLAEQRRTPRLACVVQLGLPAGSDVLEVHREPVRTRPGAHLVDRLLVRGARRLERHRLAGGDRGPVVPKSVPTVLG